MTYPHDPPKNFTYIKRDDWELIPIKILNKISKEFFSYKKVWNESTREEWWTLLKSYLGTGSAKTGIKYDKMELNRINKTTKYMTFCRPQNEFKWYEVYFGKEFS